MKNLILALAIVSSPAAADLVCTTSEVEYGIETRGEAKHSNELMELGATTGSNIIAYGSHLPATVSVPVLSVGVITREMFADYDKPVIHRKIKTVEVCKYKED